GGRSCQPPLGHAGVPGGVPDHPPRHPVRRAEADGAVQPSDGPEGTPDPDGGADLPGGQVGPLFALNRQQAISRSQLWQWELSVGPQTRGGMAMTPCKGVAERVAALVVMLTLAGAILLPQATADCPVQCGYYTCRGWVSGLDGSNVCFSEDPW